MIDFDKEKQAKCDMTENLTKPKLGNKLLWEFKNIICGIRASPTWLPGLRCSKTSAYRLVPMEEKITTHVRR